MKAKPIPKVHIELTDEHREELKNVKIYKIVHLEVKKRVAVTEDNISEFVSQAIIEKLAK